MYSNEIYIKTSIKCNGYLQANRKDLTRSVAVFVFTVYFSRILFCLVPAIQGCSLFFLYLVPAESAVPDCSRDSKIRRWTER